MDQATLQSLLSSLIATWENEVVEFKQAGKTTIPTKLVSISRRFPTKPTCAT